ncbi:hypothetical protein ISCGN_003151 [Ixodes scapularis]
MGRVNTVNVDAMSGAGVPCTSDCPACFCGNTLGSRLLVEARGGALRTRLYQQKYDCNVTDTTCSVCGACEETIEHLLIACKALLPVPIVGSRIEQALDGRCAMSEEDDEAEAVRFSRTYHRRTFLCGVVVESLPRSVAVSVINARKKTDTHTASLRDASRPRSTRAATSDRKPALFRAPKEDSRRLQGGKNLSREDKRLADTSAVCERHF